MATFDYLKEQLNEFVKQFKNAKASYEYDELANLHTIEILPQAVFDSEEFTDWECDFFKRAYKAIPGEDISFISEIGFSLNASSLYNAKIILPTKPEIKSVPLNKAHCFESSCLTDRKFPCCIALKVFSSLSITMEMDLLLIF